MIYLNVIIMEIMESWKIYTWDKLLIWSSETGE